MAGGAYEVENGDLTFLGDLAAQHGITLHELSQQQASLEEAFMQMTADSVEYHAGPGAPGAPGAPPAWGAGWQQGQGAAVPAGQQPAPAAPAVPQPAPQGGEEN